MTTKQRTARRGNYSMMMGFSVLGILGFGALGVDISYISMANTQAQAVADAASHAALVAFRNSNGADNAAKTVDGQAAAQWIVDHNNVGLDGSGNLASLEFGQFNSSTGNFSSGMVPHNSARAQVDRKGATNGVDLLIAPIMGFMKADIEQAGTTVANPREIVLVIDSSCSMVGAGENGTGDAIATFADYMVNNKLPLDRIGAVQFHGNGSPDASIWRPMVSVDGNEGNIISTWTKSAWTSFCCNYNTNQGAGINIARTMLNTSGNDLAFKAIIIISDGNPYPYSTWEPYFTSESIAADNDDIHVWTVAFGDSINKSLMWQNSKGLGHPSSQASWESQYFAPNAAGVKNIVKRIAESIPVAMVE